MTAEELKQKLSSLGMSNEYTIDDGLNYDTYVLYHNYSKWEFFFYNERGGRSFEHIFHSEYEACEYVFMFAERMNKGRIDSEKRRQEEDEREKHARIVTTQIPGDGFIMTDTKKVYDKE